MDETSIEQLDIIDKVIKLKLIADVFGIVFARRIMVGYDRIVMEPMTGVAASQANQPACRNIPEGRWC